MPERIVDQSTDRRHCRDGIIDPFEDCIGLAAQLSVSLSERQPPQIDCRFSHQVSADSSEIRCAGDGRLSRLALFILCFDHRHVIIPENESLNSEIESTKAFHFFLEAGESRVRNSRTQNYIGSRDDAGAPALDVAGRSRDDDEVVALFHPREIAPYSLDDVGIVGCLTVRSIWQVVERKILTDGG